MSSLNGVADADEGARVAMRAPVAAPPPPTLDDDSSDSSDDDEEDDEEKMFPLAKKPRLESQSRDEDEDEEPDNEMQFGYEDEDEQPEVDDEKEEEEDDEDESRHSIGRDNADPWENDDDDDDDEEYEGAISAGGASFDSPASFLNWLQRRKATGADPRQLLLSLLDQLESSSGVHELLWGLVDQLGAVIARSIVSIRRKLSHLNTFDDVCQLLQNSSKIIVLSGAGISVSSGIPDFRSKQGIYTRLRNEFGMPEPECMFDLHYFQNNPDPFYSFAHELWPGNHMPSAAHRFISILEQKGKLLRNYSQNIDNLERCAGIKNVYQCHGSFATASCLTCSRQVPGDELGDDILSKRKSYCKVCRDENALRKDPGRVAKLADPAFGIMKPDIVFFGEPLSKEFDELLAKDLPVADLVLVMGSSLKVHPVASVLSVLPAHVPLVLLNKELVGRPHEFDVQLLGLCDDICNTLCRRLHWSSDAAEVEFEFVPPNLVLFPGHELSSQEQQDDADEADDVSGSPRSRRRFSDWYYSGSVSIDRAADDADAGLGSTLLLPQVLPPAGTSPAYIDLDSADAFADIASGPSGDSA